MNPSSFFNNRDTPLIADASAVINLNATRVAQEILKVIPHPVFVAENAWQELEDGAAKGHDDAKCLNNLAKLGLVAQVSLSGKGLEVYEGLITGTTVESLDDGEAATIAYASEMQGIALIDEAKAKRLCKAKFSVLELVSTTELLLRPEVADCLGPEQHAEAIIRALKDARMNVPQHLVGQVLDLIGPDVAKTCPCLPRLIRNTS